MRIGTAQQTHKRVVETSVFALCSLHTRERERDSNLSADFRVWAKELMSTWIILFLGNPSPAEPTLKAIHFFGQTNSSWYCIKILENFQQFRASAILVDPGPS